MPEGGKLAMGPACSHPRGTKERPLLPSPLLPSPRHHPLHSGKSLSNRVPPSPCAIRSALNIASSGILLKQLSDHTCFTQI